MKAQSPVSVPKVESQQVPEDLLQRFHEANQHFHEAKENLTKEMDNTEYRHQERVDRAEDKVREAEREVEDITAKIHATLENPEKPQSEERGEIDREQG